MAELADAADSKSAEVTPRGGSTPPPGTNKINSLRNQRIFGCAFLCPNLDSAVRAFFAYAKWYKVIEMLDHFSLVRRLTSEVRNWDQERQVNDFASELGWRPSDRLELPASSRSLLVIWS
jgi:hypothetical protein